MHITHIPKPQTIPKRIALPNTYSVSSLLALASTPIPLSPEKLGTLTSLLTFTLPSPSSDAIDVKPASRRRRTGRKGKKPQSVVQVADIETRRKRHGHGTWGWTPYVTGEAEKHHQQELEASWRHNVPIVGVAA
jgi:hypothetical protein